MKEQEEQSPTRRQLLGILQLLAALCSIYPIGYWFWYYTDPARTHYHWTTGPNTALGVVAIASALALLGCGLGNVFGNED